MSRGVDSSTNQGDFGRAFHLRAGHGNDRLRDLLDPRPQRFAISLGGTAYWLRLHYADAPEGGWLLDISDLSDASILHGVPLVTRADLLAQYSYLDLKGELWVATDADPDAVPTFENLGIESRLYFSKRP